MVNGCRYDWAGTRRFVETQRLRTVGAHDAVLLPLPPAGGAGGAGGDAGALLAVVANGARWNASAPSKDGETCDAGVSIYRWDERARAFAPAQRLANAGCTTFVRVLRAAGRTLLLVAVERTPAGAFDAAVGVYEWRADGGATPELG